MKKIIAVFLTILFLACCSKSEPDKITVIERPNVKMQTQEELRKRIEEERAKEKAAIEALKNREGQIPTPNN